MSKSIAARRIALLSTSSVGLAAIVSAASLGAAVMAPTAAWAQTCAPAPSSGAGTGSVTYNAGTYAAGIACTPAGDLNLTVQAVSGSTVSSFGTGGIVAIAPASPTNSDDLLLRFTGSTAGGQSTPTFNFGTAFPALLNAESRAGDVTVELEIDQTALGSNSPTISADNAATTRVIRAVSTAGGDVTVRNLGEVPATGFNGEPLRRGVIQTTSSSANTTAVAIEARSVGGGDVTVDLGYGSAVGRLYGILAEANGDGAVNILGVGQAAPNIAGSAGVRVVAGTGPVVVGSPPYRNNTFASPAFTGRTGVYVDAGGDITVTASAQGTDYGVDIVNVAAGTTTTVNIGGRLSNGFSQTTGGLAAVRAKGAGTLLLNFTRAQRDMNFNFSGMTGSVEVTVKDGGAWVPTPGVTTTVVGSNYNKITLERGGLLAAAVGDGFNYGSLEPATVLNFADPSFVLDNAGIIIVGPAGSIPDETLHEAELRIVGLGELRHSGVIQLGSAGKPVQGAVSSPHVNGLRIGRTDGWYDDILVFENGTWIGEGGTVIFDVDINRTQTNCTREAVTHNFQAADCLRFVDAVVEGQAYVNIAPVLGGDRGRLTQQISDEGVLLIEGLGTTTLAADNFALDPAMVGYNPALGTLDKGLYQYALLFDEDANQFRLYGGPSAAAYQAPMAATAAHSLWRLSTGGWFERQADLRGGLEPGLGGGVWLRARGEKADREATGVFSAGGQSFSTNNASEATSYAITGGVDLLSASDGDTAWVVGVMAGYAHTDVDYGPTGNAQAMDGWTAGGYASFMAGPLFIDAVVNANNVIVDTDAPAFNFQPEGTILSSRLLSVGGQVEAGWRFGVGESLFAEPLVSVSYVRSKMEDLDIKPDDFSRPGLEVSFDDPSSLRAGIGGRIGVDREFVGARTQLSLLGRVWNDMEGENTASIHNLAFPNDPDIAMVDDVSGQFSELQLGAAVYSPGGGVSGFLNLGGRLGDDYEAKTGSVGVRVAW